MHFDPLQKRNKSYFFDFKIRKLRNFKKCGRNLVDLGTPLGKGVKLSVSGSTPSKRNVVGYSVLKAPNMGAAKKLLKGHPHLGWSSGCDIEVHESLRMPK